MKGEEKIKEKYKDFCGTDTKSSEKCIHLFDVLQNFSIYKPLLQSVFSDKHYKRAGEYGVKL